MDERSWDGKAYPLNRFYIDGEQVEPDYENWEIWDDEGNCKLLPGPKQYRHTLGTIINSLADSGFVIQRFWEEVGSFDAKPGTWEHFTAVAPATLGVWSCLGMTRE